MISKESSIQTHFLVFWWAPNAKGERVCGHHLYTCFIGADEELSPEIATNWLVSASLPLLDFTYPQRIGTWCDKRTILALKFNVHCIPKHKHHCCWCITHANKEIHLPVTVAVATFFWCLEVTTMNKYHIQRLGMYTEINKQCIGSKLCLLSFETSALNDYVMIVMTS